MDLRIAAVWYWSTVECLVTRYSNVWRFGWCDNGIELVTEARGSPG